MASIVAVLEPEHDERAVAELVRRLAALGRPGTVCRIAQQTVVIADGSATLADHLREVAGVEIVLTPADGLPLAGRAHLTGDTAVDVGGVRIGGGDLTVMAGPCAVESHAQLRAAAFGVRARGAAVLRGGAYKPRTSPYSFQGLGFPGLRLLAEVGQETGLPVVTEVLDRETVKTVAAHSQILQIGTRNAQNFSLLRAVGATGRPVLLKRGFGCTVEEWLYSAEYVLREGNGNVILCERGIRTYEKSTRFTLDLSAVVVAKRLSHLPVVVDPSHGCGLRELVHPMAIAAAAVGADGLLIDVHPDPSTARCDAAQAIPLDEFGSIMAQLRHVLTALGRRLVTAGERDRVRRRPGADWRPVALPTSGRARVLTGSG